MAPHYEFFQRRTVHVNSQVLLSSTHPRLKPRRDFPGRLFDFASGSEITIGMARRSAEVCTGVRLRRTREGKSGSAERQ